MSKDDELVLCMPRHRVFSTGYFSGITTDVESVVKNWCALDLTFVRRGNCENDPHWKQIVPYLLVRREVHEQTKHVVRFASYTRTKGSGEHRLHGKKSLGFGGHINPEDMPEDFEASYRRTEPGSPESLLFTPGSRRLRVVRPAMLRELHEELDIRVAGQNGLVPKFTVPEVSAIINDDSTPVGSVHLGLVITVCVSGCDVEAKGAEVGSLEWLTYESLTRGDMTGYEAWSQLLIQSLKFDTQIGPSVARRAPELPNLASVRAPGVKACWKG